MHYGHGKREWYWIDTSMTLQYQLNSKKMDRTELMISLCFGEKNDAQYVTGALLIQSRINKVKLDKC